MATRYPIDHHSLSEHERLILHVLRLYYEHDLTQAEIAHRMGFSRPKVTRLVAEGRDRGLVEITIAEPAGGFTPLEIALEEYYGLDEAIVVASGDDRQTTELTAGGMCGALLDRVCTPESVLGVSWGISARALADAIPSMSFRCHKIVSLVGGMGRVKPELHSNQVATTLADKLGVKSSHLVAPAVARSVSSRNELMEMPGIEEVLDEAADCDIAVVGIGSILPTSTMIQAGYFTQEEFLGLKDRGAAGDVCCHFVDATGTPCLPEISERIVGLTLEELWAIPKTIGVVTGAEKTAGVAAVLKGGFVGTLVCDQDLARSLLEIPEGEGARDEGR
jgi:deoxyribonucleoside regulator